jgi:serine/threonine-protein kinase
MGSVYLAHDTALDRRVAIKVVRWGSGDPDAARRFAREARAGASLSHPNVVTVHDVGVLPDGGPFLVMEYVPGPTLRERLTQERILEPGIAVTLLRGVAAAIEAAHTAGLVHRDLKPENILLAQGPGGLVPKVADFGLARAYEVDPWSGATLLTREGGAPGTPEYMAPEQIRQEEPSPAWDRWALGVMAFEMLTGELPYAAAVGEGRTLRTPLLDEREDELRRVFRDVLAPERARRPATATAVVDAIARAASRCHE